jgi:hypothetical protein
MATDPDLTRTASSSPEPTLDAAMGLDDADIFDVTEMTVRFRTLFRF